MESSGKQTEIAGHRFPASRRIKSRDEFQRVFKQGVVATDDVLVVHAILLSPGEDGGSQETKLGLSISKKVGHAPLRNRWKRLIREAFRQSAEIPEGLLLVVRPRKGAIPEHAKICRSLPRLAKKVFKRLRK